jgi:hypothetical protein
MKTVPAILVVALLVTLTGCAPTVALQPAADAISPICASVIVHLPDTVDGQPSRVTDAQGTGAWGNPAAVILRCGVPVPAPTATLPCVTVDNIDWLRDDSKDPSFVFTTFGRDPAIEVIIDSRAVSGASALSDLSYAVSATPTTSDKCLAPENVQ